MQIVTERCWRLIIAREFPDLVEGYVSRFVAIDQHNGIQFGIGNAWLKLLYTEHGHPMIASDGELNQAGQRIRDLAFQFLRGQLLLEAMQSVST